MREYNKRDTLCRYNMGVLCEEADRQCDRCGWNPKVNKRRVNYIRQLFAKHGTGWTWLWREL